MDSPWLLEPTPAGLTRAGVTVTAVPADWLTAWPAAVAAWPGELPPEFAPAALVEECQRLGFRPEVTAACAPGLATALATPERRQLAWLAYWTLTRCDPTPAAAWAWPIPPEAPLFYATIWLAAAPGVRVRQQALGIPPQVTLDTLRDVGRWLERDRAFAGGWVFRDLGWLVRHFADRLFALGRLQYEFSEYGGDYHVVRRRRDGCTLLLAGDGQVFRPDGQYDGTNGLSAGPQAWTAHYERTATAIRGYPIAPHGAALARELVLPTAEWDVVLERGLPVFSLHIPAGDPLDAAACGASFRQALDFFPRHFPAFHAAGFVSGSWLFDSQLALILPDASNIVRFQREFYLFPLPKANDHQFFERIFGGPVDPATAPRDTQLRRGILDHQAQGGRWRLSGALRLPQDAAWGDQVYQTRTAAFLATLT